MNLEGLLRALNAANISLTPHNIELWQSHLEGRLPALSFDIDQYYRQNGELTDEYCTDLHEKYFPYTMVETDLREKMLALCSSVDEQIYALSVTLEEKSQHNGSLSIEAETARLQYLLQSLGTLTKTVRNQSDEVTRTISSAREDLSSLRRLKSQSWPPSSLDITTGVLSRVTLEKELSDWTYATTKSKRALAIINIRLNERRLSALPGAEANEILFAAAKLINENIKGSDELCRFDTASFAIVLPMTRLAAADILGEKIRAAFSAAALITQLHDEGQPAYIGVSSFQAPETPSEFLRRAATYAAFAENNDLKVVICEDSPELNDFRVVG